MAAAAIMQTHQVDLLILDFDMPLGNAADLIAWMVENDRQIPIVTASGWEPNLAVMDSILVKTNIPYRIFSKQQVIVGEADEYIRSFLT
jgi:DNA-binding NarL/FixJ family response regulator